MSVLVTGGAGYIGSHLVDLLMENNYEVVVYDNLSTGHRKAVHKKAEFVHGDLLDTPFLGEVFQYYKPDAVFHLASLTLVGESMERPFDYYDQNINSILSLLRVMDYYGVNKLIFSSTANLFSQPQEMPISESEVIRPGSVYGSSKAIVEEILSWMYGLDYTCLRYFNAAGAHPRGHIGEDHNPETHLIPSVIQVALGQRPRLDVYGKDYETKDGTCIRDYVHVYDLARAHLLALRELETVGGVHHYNLGNGTGFSVQEVVKTVQRVTGNKIPVTVRERRYGDPAVLIADSTLAHQRLGWQPTFKSIDSLVESAWKWHKKNPEGYND